MARKWITGQLVESYAPRLLKYARDHKATANSSELESLETSKPGGSQTVLLLERIQNQKFSVDTLSR
jgi:hypothetical protein